MGLDAAVTKIRIEGSGKKRKITCPYCKRVQNVTLVTHLKRSHPSEWEAWTKEFTRLYNENNNLKHVMKAFSNGTGQLVLSWTVIDREIKRLASATRTPPRYVSK